MISPKMMQICSGDDNLITFDVKSDCIAIKMWDNTFAHGSERYFVVIEAARDPELW
jgi:hypothetical protein